MTDIPGNIGTDATLMLGVASESDFDRDGDSDWFRIYLNKGQSYAFRVDGEYGSIYSLTLRDANGNVIKSVDAHEQFYWISYEASFDFTARSSGIYYLDARGVNTVYDGTPSAYTIQASLDASTSFTDAKVIAVDQDYTEGASFDGDQDDLLDGGAGTDTISVEVSGVATKIDLATGTATRGSELDRLYGIENAIGSAYGDEIRGSGGANELRGLAGNDLLFGGAGNDAIYGGVGDDRITGDSGYDRMYGEAGKDVFDINLGDTGVGLGRRDIIADFQRGSDRIDLVSIDAKSGIAGDQAFTFIGTKGFTAAGQLHYLYDSGNTIVQGDVNGDKVADFEIQLTGKIALTATDFVL